MDKKLAVVSEVADKTFDFVILSGCVLAARLSENPNVTVALLEAGKANFDDPAIAKVDGWMELMFKPDNDWVFRTTPQSKAVNNVTTPDGKPTDSFYWSRGKGLGGSTTINFLLWTRPQREEIEASKRAETFHPPEAVSDSEAFKALYKTESVGQTGPIPVSFARTTSGIESVLQETQTLKAHGIQVNSDPISGTWRNTSIIDPQTQTRSHAARHDYLGLSVPRVDRPNLKVLTDAYVRRVLTKKDGGEVVATGVEFEHKGQIHNVHAAKEVILSASTVKSPHILELSGIGDPAVLEPLGIPVKIDLPSVGANVQDHLIVSAYVFEMALGHDFVTSDTIKLPEIQRKLRDLYGDASGPLAVALTGPTFLPLQVFSDRADDIIAAQERKLAAVADTLAPGMKEQYDLQLEMLKNPSVPDLEILVFPFSIPPNDSGKPFVGILPSIGHPFSRGSIHASSSDPSVQPTIEPNYFSEDIDLEILVDSIKFLRKVTNTSPWKDFAEKEVVPGVDVSSDEQIREYVKQNLSTTWHACGSCSMLPREKGGVVDSKLKVYGTRNLRVADLSILPLVPSVHTQATTYGIAEQAADIIKADHGF
ncbi:GMC oxidoreductase [Pilatotrama ljubarskyi]|nr:GMC oxidoreductase [Pilatotrama ljubarskyi]